MCVWWEMRGGKGGPQEGERRWGWVGRWRRGGGVSYFTPWRDQFLYRGLEDQRSHPCSKDQGRNAVNRKLSDPPPWAGWSACMKRRWTKRDEEGGEGGSIIIYKYVNIYDWSVWRWWEDEIRQEEEEVEDWCSGRWNYYYYYYSWMKMSPCGGVTRALDRACTTTLNQDFFSSCLINKLIDFVVAPAAADKRWVIWRKWKMRHPR